MLKNPALRLKQATVAIAISTLTLTTAAPPNYSEAGKQKAALNGAGKAKSMAVLLAQKVGTEKGTAHGFNLQAEAYRSAYFNQGLGAGRVRATNEVPGLARAQAEAAASAEAERVGVPAGYARADADARRNSAEPGRNQGIADANALDQGPNSGQGPTALGTTAGNAAGDARAKQTALETDYPAARKAFYDAKFAERVNSESSLSVYNEGNVAGAPQPAGGQRYSFLSSTSLDNARFYFAPPNVIVPDERPTDAAEMALEYCRTNAVVTDAVPATDTQPAQPAVNDTVKCMDEYKAAYTPAWIEAFKANYVAAYNERFEQAFAAAQPAGKAQADAMKLEFDRTRGSTDRLGLVAAHRDGEAQGYKEVYDVKFPPIYRDRYNQVIGPYTQAVSDRRYNEVYNDLYNQYFAAARAQAYESHRTALYNSAHQRAELATFNAKYPAYKAAEISRGQKDEAAEFVRVPVRLLKTSISETIDDGVMEPGEKLTVNFSLRNFSDAKIQSAELDIKAQALDQNGAMVQGAIAVLPRALEAKSITHISQAFDIRLNEAALARATQVRVTFAVRGQAIATETFTLQAKTLTLVQLVGTPEVRLGYRGAVRVRVTNQSTKVLPEAAVLKLQTAIQGVVFEKTTEAVRALQARETVDVEFPFMNNSYGMAQSIPFVATLDLAQSGRSVGMLNETRSVPSIQDYKITIRRSDLDNMRNNGREGLRFEIANVSNRLATQSLSIEAKIMGPNASLFRFRNGNTLSWSAIRPGNYSSGKFVVFANSRNSGGSVIFTVKEGGKLLGYIEERF